MASKNLIKSIIVKGFIILVSDVSFFLTYFEKIFNERIKRISMSSNLLIVESPSKVKTISSILGKDYKIMSCNGHIRDLPKKGIGIDIENEFMPIYEIPAERKNIIRSLKDAAKKSKMVWLATDEDREGEAISWHLKQALSLSDEQIQRISFNEITKKAILHAIKNPKKINQNLVDAQQARRILDRLVGFELSPVLWQKLSRGLSAGRVQSVATKLVVEREREIENFKAKTSYPVNAVFSKAGSPLIVKSKLKKKYDKAEEVSSFLNDCVGSRFEVSHVEKKQGKRSPSAPFTTSTLQQEAARKLGMPVASTMRVAQALYEAGKITYMRTDSTRLSDQALSESGQIIEKLFGKEYHQPRRFKSKSANAQEAHEAIRPTNFGVKSGGNSSGEEKLYELIWKRTVASQMADVELNKTNAQIKIEKHQKNIFVATGEEIIFDGFLKVYGNDQEENEQADMLPPLTAGEELFAEKIFSKETRERHPARYSEASLVKTLEEKGIGRPSTYVSIITTIQKRNYVEIKDKESERISVNFFELNRAENEFKQSTLSENYGADKKKMFPTDIGRLVNDFLEENFKSIMKFDFTASVEKKFDEVAMGKMKYNEMLKGFYTPFNENIKQVSTTGERIKFQKLLGLDPKTQKSIYARVGTYGPFLQLGETPEKESEKKPQYFKIPQGTSVETLKLEEALEIISISEKQLGSDPKTGYDLTVKYGKFGPYIQMNDPKGRAKPRNVSIGKELSPKDITLEQALKLFELPRNLGEFEGEPIETNKGRFGPYVKHSGQFISFPRNAEYTPLNITKEQAIVIIKNKIEEDKKKYIHIFDDGIKVARGKKSPYIVYNKKIYRLKADEDPEKMTHEDFINRVPYKKKETTKTR